MIPMHSYNNIMFSFDLQVITYVGIYTVMCALHSLWRTIHDPMRCVRVPVHDLTGITFSIIDTDI